MSPRPNDSCVICMCPIGPMTIAGEPAVCGWVPPGGGPGILAIVSAHFDCMGIPQLIQATRSWEAEYERERVNGYRTRSVIHDRCERRLSELLARQPLREYIAELEASAYRRGVEAGMAGTVNTLAHVLPPRRPELDSCFDPAGRSAFSNSVGQFQRFGEEIARAGRAMGGVTRNEDLGVQEAMRAVMLPAPPPAAPRASPVTAPVPAPPEKKPDPPCEGTRFSLLEVD